ncbi:MAG: EVE domain-containing protein [Thermoplasmata archaeon]
MARWLVKSEPSVYSYAALERDGHTEWDGVHNALALQHLKRMRPGDRLMFYHSGAERAGVGIARVASMPHPDPTDARGSWSVEVRPVRRLQGPIPLAELRSDRGLAGFILLRFSRLSVLPVTADQWDRVLSHEPGSAGARGPARQGSARGSRSSHRVAAARKRGAT